jgi:integrase
MLSNNPVAFAEAPVAGDSELGQVLESDQLAAIVAGFRDLAIYPIVATAALTGARRNEILALRWTDLGDKTLTFAQALEETKSGRGFKEPKTARGNRTIAIDDSLAEILAAERRKCLGLAAGLASDSEVVDLSLIRMPAGALLFPAPPSNGEGFDMTKPRDARNISKVFSRRAKALGFPGLRFHDLRATHETLLLDAGVPVHVVAARCGHDPAVLLRIYARRTKKADASAAAIVGIMAKGVLGLIGSSLGPGRPSGLDPAIQVVVMIDEDGWPSGLRHRS